MQKYFRQHIHFSNTTILFLGFLVIDCIAILLLNDNHFLFSLDDPYIHLALAENILHGHYGVNANEYSAPSSSILWPFFLVPILLTPIPQLLIVLTNISASIISLLFASKILSQIKKEITIAISSKVEWLLYFLFLLSANLVGLVLLGMEHSLQVMFAVITAWGLIEKIQTGKTSRLLWLSIIMAPLLRYESLTISAMALPFLFLQKDYLKSIFAGIALLIPLVVFSLFLKSLHLGFLPESVFAKSNLSANSSHILNHFLHNLHFPTGFKALPMLVLSLYLCFFSIFAKPKNAKNALAFVASVALLLHLFFGSIGWFFRYEIYVWTFSLCIFVYLFFTHDFFTPKTLRTTMAKSVLVYCLFISLSDGLGAIVLSPLASSNVYHQQFQMHRFITEFYQQPVGVNDLGLASFDNNNYVLDLWGLASHEAHERRLNDENTEWMEELSNRHQVKLVMIYNTKMWFPEVPNHWIKMAQLNITGPKVISLFPVSFYLLDNQYLTITLQQLRQFSKTLPTGTVLEFTTLNDNTVKPK